MRFFSDDEDDFFKYGKKAFEKGNYYDAISNFTKVINLAPKYNYVYNYRGIPYERLGDYNKAIEIELNE